MSILRFETSGFSKCFPPNPHIKNEKAERKKNPKTKRTKFCVWAESTLQKGQAQTFFENSKNKKDNKIVLFFILAFNVVCDGPFFIIAQIYKRGHGSTLDSVFQCPYNGFGCRPQTLKVGRGRF